MNLLLFQCHCSLIFFMTPSFTYRQLIWRNCTRHPLPVILFVCLSVFRTCGLSSDGYTNFYRVLMAPLSNFLTQRRPLSSGQVAVNNSLQSTNISIYLGNYTIQAWSSCCWTNIASQMGLFYRTASFSLTLSEPCWSLQRRKTAPWLIPHKQNHSWITLITMQNCSALLLL